MNDLRKRPLISVIVPVYKTEQYVETCIRSILNQTYSNIELILVDDGSPDKCGEICDTYANCDSRVRVIHKQNAGVSAARNDGINVCTGDYICFVDSDDYINENLFVVCESFIMKNNVDMVCWGMNFVDNDGNITREECASLKKDEMVSRDLIVSDIIPQLIHLKPKTNTGLSAWITNKLFKRDIIEKYNIRFDEEIKLWEDGIFTIEYLKYCNNLCCTGDSYYYYRDTPNSLSTKFDENLHIYVVKIMQKYQQLYDDLYDFNNEFFKKYSVSLADGIILRTLGCCSNGIITYADGKRNIFTMLCNQEFVELFTGRCSKSIFISQMFANRFPKLATEIYILCHKIKQLLLSIK